MNDRTSRRFPHIYYILLLAAGVCFPSTLANAADITEVQAQEKRTQAIVKRVVNATVCLTHGDHDGIHHGSGVIVSDDGLIMTAAHVISSPGTELKVIFSDGRQAKAKSLGCDYFYDAGLAQITDAGKWPFVEKGRSGDLQPGVWCMAAGHPGGLKIGRQPTVRLGRILAVSTRRILSDATISPGDSGGPLFDLEGHVIGIHTGIGPDPKWANAHVAVDSFRKIWNDLIQGKEFDTADKEDDDNVLLNSVDGNNLQKFGKANKKLLSDLSCVTVRAGRSVVTVLCDGRVVALGTVVRKNGYILTKASQLSGPVSCRVVNRELPATIVNQNQEYDLALLHVAIDDLTPVEWADETEAKLGIWLVTPDASGNPLALGMLGHVSRKIALMPHNQPFLGIALDPNKSNATVQQVTPDSPARKAGLRPGDVIVSLDGQFTPDNSTLNKKLGMHKPGDKVTIEVKRDDKNISLTATLVFRESETDRACLNANLDPNQDSATIVRVTANGPAAEAGLRLGDVIVALNGRPTPDIQAVIAELEKYKIGDRITIGVQRDNKTISLVAILDSDLDDEQGPLSRRRDGFPSAFTHDSLLMPTQCGGPILGLEGRAVGLNIARVDRTASYALPANIVSGLVVDLLTDSSLPEAERAVVQAVQKLGGSTIREDKSRTIIGVDFSGQSEQVTDAGLKELRSLKSLKVLRLTGCVRVTDIGLKEFKELSELRELRLGGTQVTDAGLKELQHCKKLQILGLASTQVTDVGLKELKELKDLKELVLKGTPVTPAGMSDLRKALPKLKIIAYIGI